MGRDLSGVVYRHVDWVAKTGLKPKIRAKKVGRLPAGTGELDFGFGVDGF